MREIIHMRGEDDITARLRVIGRKWRTEVAARIGRTPTEADLRFALADEDLGSRGSQTPEETWWHLRDRTVDMHNQAALQEYMKTLEAEAWQRSSLTGLSAWRLAELLEYIGEPDQVWTYAQLAAEFGNRDAISYVENPEDYGGL